MPSAFILINTEVGFENNILKERKKDSDSKGSSYDIWRIRYYC